MTAIVRNNFRVYNARKFIGSLDAVNGVYTDALYLGIARPQQWNVDSTPEVPGNNIKDELTDWSDLMFMKRLFSSNISHMILKRVWAANSLYDVYRHDWNGYSTSSANNSVSSSITQEIPTDLSKVKCYCISPSNIIYICLTVPKDANGVPSPSLINPDYGTTSIPGTSYSTANQTGIVYCADGYVWLRIADSTDLIAQFDTLGFYPIQTVGAVAVGAASLSQQTWQTNAESYKGGIYNILITGSGSGYQSGTTGAFKITSPATETTHVSVIGDGQGLEYVVQYNAGKVDKIIVTNPGQGYTWAKVYINNNTGAGASAIAILTPLYGLAVDPVKTLNAFYISVQSVIYDDENVGDIAINHGTDFTVDNDYRKVVLVSNPTKSGVLASTNKLDLTYGLTNTSNGGISIPVDTIMTSNTTKVRVVDSGVTSNDKPIIRVIQTAPLNSESATQNDNVITGLYTSTHGDFTATEIIVPDVDLGSGDIIYSDYRRPISRAKRQSESFQIILEF